LFYIYAVNCCVSVPVVGDDARKYHWYWH